jgi:Mrp family chromosome partitioning ATPase
LIDCDLVFPELDRFTEMSCKYGLVDCLKGDVPIEEAMTSFANLPCWIMPVGQSEVDSNELLKAGQIEGFLSRLREQFDYILLNAPPILPVATMNVLEQHTDVLLLVVRANLTSQQAVKRALSSLRLSKPFHVILNGVPMRTLPTYMIDYSAVGTRVPV